MKKCAHSWQFSLSGCPGLPGQPVRPHGKKRLKLARAIWIGTALFVLTVSAGANPPLKAEVMHWWTSPGESAAVEQFAEAFNKAGGEWVDVAVVGGNNAIPAELSRVTGGNPPTAMQLPLGKQLDDLVAQHLLSNLDDLAAADNFKSVIPDGFLKA